MLDEVFYQRLKELLIDYFSGFGSSIDNSTDKGREVLVAEIVAGMKVLEENADIPSSDWWEKLHKVALDYW